MTDQNTNSDYYKDELYLDEDFRMLAETYPADVSAIGVTTLIDYVEALEAELSRRIKELHYANTVCMEQKHKIARRDEIIKRLAEAGENLIQLANFGNKKAIEYIDVWSALTKELEAGDD